MWHAAGICSRTSCFRQATSLSFRNMSHHRSMVRRGVRAALPFAGAALGLLVSPVSGAQAWIFDPRIEVEAIYDDNYRLTSQPGQEIEVTGGAIDAELPMRKEWQAALLEIGP